MSEDRAGGADGSNVSVTRAELHRLLRIEAAAQKLLDQMGGRRSATPTLEALAELRQALKEPTP